MAGVAAGGGNFEGLGIAPAYFAVEENGTLTGLTISAVNNIKGRQKGLTIGIVNMARSLNGLQLGLLNFAGNKKNLKWLPIINAHFD